MKKTEKYNKRDKTDKILYIISLSTFLIFILLFIYIIKDYNVWIINDNIFFALLAILSLVSLTASLYFIIRLMLKRKKHDLITH